MVQEKKLQESWYDFGHKLQTEFVPFHSEGMTRDWFNNLREVMYGSDSISNIWNIIVTIDEMGETEKWNMFRMGLKLQVHLQVMKSEKHLWKSCKDRDERGPCGIITWSDL